MKGKSWVPDDWKPEDWDEDEEPKAWINGLRVKGMELTTENIVRMGMVYYLLNKQIEEHLGTDEFEIMKMEFSKDGISVNVMMNEPQNINISATVVVV